MTRKTWLRRIIYFLLIAGIVVFGILYYQKVGTGRDLSEQETNPPTPLYQGGTIRQNPAKSVETIEFGNWQPHKSRRVLGMVQSSSDISIYSKLSGDIAKVFVEIGDNVYQGEIIAKFSRENDLAQISYENTLNSLENTKLTTENSVRAAEIALENARNDLEQTIQSTEQNHSQAYTILYSQARNMDTVISNSLSWADRLLGATKNYDSDPRGGKVGRNNSILKNDTKNLIREISRKVKNSRDLEPYQQNEAQILRFANEKRQILKDLQKIIRNMDTLIRGTSSSLSFPETTKRQLQAEVEGKSAKIDGSIVSLESAIESAKSGNESINTAILAAENRVKNAESNLELAQANARAQVANVENQRNIAAKSIQDLNVRAPFDGKISAKFVNDFDRVNPGQKLFSIVAKDSVPEIVAHLSAEETHLLNDLEKIKIELANGETIAVGKVAISGKLDSASQKMEVKFSPTEEFRGNLTVGSIANILLPINTEESNLIPISAVSFEPDGAEVFVLTNTSGSPLLAGEGEGEAENPAKNTYKIERRKVQTGKIVSSAVEILDGLKSREILVKYRNRVNAGDLVDIK